MSALEVTIANVVGFWVVLLITHGACLMLFESELTSYTIDVLVEEQISTSTRSSMHTTSAAPGTHKTTNKSDVSNFERKINKNKKLDLSYLNDLKYSNRTLDRQRRQIDSRFFRV